MLKYKQPKHIRRATDVAEIAISTPDAHPIAMFMFLNPEMKAFDVQLNIGNFPTEEAAQEFAAAMISLLQEHLGATLNRLLDG